MNIAVQFGVVGGGNHQGFSGQQIVVVIPQNDFVAVIGQQSPKLLIDGMGNHSQANTCALEQASLAQGNITTAHQQNLAIVQIEKQWQKIHGSLPE